MPSVWQQTCTLKETRATDSFKELVAYFTTYQSIVDTNNHSKSTVPTARILSLCGPNTNHFQHVTTTSFPGRGSMVRYRDCCPKHPNNSHSWGDCFQNLRNFKNRNTFQHNGSYPISSTKYINSCQEIQPSRFQGHNTMYHSFCSQRNEQGYKRPYSFNHNPHYNARLQQSTTAHTSSALVPYNPLTPQGEGYNYKDDEFHPKV